MGALGFRIDLEPMLAIKADCSRIVANDVKPNRSIIAEPFDACAHQGCGGAIPVEVGIDH